ncbi:MAG: DUF998 domain-containing protein [Pseudomonadota bacterium]
MSARLIGQCWIAAAAMAVMIAISLFDPLHDPMTQHMSELVAGSWWSAIAIRVLPTITGASIVLFGLGCLGQRAIWSGLAALLFGAAMVSNGLIPTGTPWHGLYGMAVFSILVPAFVAAEFPVTPALRQLSLATAFLALIYMWAMLVVGIDPPEYRGLTQRAFSAVAFGWFLPIARARL